MLDLESAIKHCEEVAKAKEKEGSLNQESFMPLDDFMRYRVECLECASEHRQLAAWLKELERYRKVRKILSQNRIATDRYGEVVLWDDIKRVLTEVKSDDTR